MGKGRKEEGQADGNQEIPLNTLSKEKVRALAYMRSPICSVRLEDRMPSEERKRSSMPRLDGPFLSDSRDIRMRDYTSWVSIVVG